MFAAGWSSWPTISRRSGMFTGRLVMMTQLERGSDTMLAGPESRFFSSDIGASLPETERTYTWPFGPAVVTGWPFAPMFSILSSSATIVSESPRLRRMNSVVTFAGGTSIRFLSETNSRTTLASSVRITPWAEGACTYWPKLCGGAVSWKMPTASCGET